MLHTVCYHDIVLEFHQSIQSPVSEAITTNADQQITSSKQHV